MTVHLTNNFFLNARGVTFKDSAGVTWALNSNTNELSATATAAGTVTGIGSTTLTIAGTASVPTVNLTALQVSNIALGGTALQAAVTTNSITGAGTAASPLELSGDAATPGNSFYYGTNGSGTKGWYASPTRTTGTFPGVLTGMTTTTNVTVSWSQEGNHVMLVIPPVGGTSNATTMTLTGLPTALQPVEAQSTVIGTLADAGVLCMGVAVFAAGSGTITFDKLASGVPSPTGWTAAGSKGVNQPFTIPYMLN